MAGDELRVGSASLLKQCPTESSLVCGLWLAYEARISSSRLTNVEPLSYSRKIPYRLNGDLCDGNLARLVDADLAIRYETTLFHAILELWHLHVGSRNGNGRPNLHIVLVHDILVQPWCKMTIWIHSHNLLPVAPLRERANLGGWLRVGKVWLVGDVQVLACHGKGIVDGVRASVGANRCDQLVSATLRLGGH